MPHKIADESVVVVARCDASQAVARLALLWQIELTEIVVIAFHFCRATDIRKVAQTGPTQLGRRILLVVKFKHMGKLVQRHTRKEI